MQHGTGREFVVDTLENALAVLEGENRRKDLHLGDVIDRIRVAKAIVEVEDRLDEPGVFGPDYALGVGVSGVSESTVGRIECDSDCRRSLAQHPWHDD